MGCATHLKSLARDVSHQRKRLIYSSCVISSVQREILDPSHSLGMTTRRPGYYDTASSGKG